MVKFAESVAQVRLNAEKLHSFADGTSEQQKFHRARVRNALHHVVFDLEGGRIFAPVKWSGASTNDMASYPTNKGPVTDNFRRSLRRVGFQQVSPGDPRHTQLYTEFVSYCARHGFTHSKPGPNERHFHILSDAIAHIYPDELPEEEREHWEGAQKISVVNRYERDGSARQACLQAKGTSCQVCEFNFADRFGELGAGFIHVHHTVPLSEIGETYRIDPERDLEPVCPNCHAMLHQSRPPLSISELRELIRLNE